MQLLGPFGLWHVLSKICLMPKRALKKKLYAHMRLSSMAQSLTLMGVRGSKSGRAGKPPPPPATCTREGLGPGMGEYTCTVLETPLGIIQRDQHATGRQGLNDFMISLTRAALRDHAGQGFIEITGAP